MISLFDVLKYQGVNVTRGMSAKKMIDILSSYPIVAEKFPAVASAVNTLQTILNNFNQAKDALEQAKSYVEQMDKALQDAQKVYDKTMSTGSGVYSAPPLTGLVIPAGSITANSILEKAYIALEKAKEQLQKAQDNVLKIEETMKSKISSIVDLVFSQKV